MSARALLLLLALAAPGPAEDLFKPSGSAEVWTYGTANQRVDASLLNPDNRVALLPDPQWTGDARVNLRLTRDAAEIVLRPRVLEQHDPGLAAVPDVDQAYLSQGFARIRLDEALTVTGGRELLTWGPANFRSPSNPIYFDAGHDEPLREVPGVDLARLDWVRGPLTLTAARVQDAGHLDRAATPAPISVFKADLRGRDSLASAVLATQVWGAPFYGGFAQATLGQAWLVYGEIGSGRRSQALAPDPSLQGPPYQVTAPSPRATTALLGAVYTLENGQTLGAEWLRDGHGFSGPSERLYFARAARAPLASLGQALGQAPALLGRNYAALLWQSNLQETGHYWRVGWTGNLQDGSSQVLLYGEKSLSARCTALAALTRDLGGPDSEFASLYRTSLSLGVKWFVF
jgi:hypothetical protein